MERPAPIGVDVADTQTAATAVGSASAASVPGVEAGQDRVVAVQEVHQLALPRVRQRLNVAMAPR